MRTISFSAAAGLSIIILALPHLVAARMTPMVHTILPFVLLGISGGFVHGIGFVPDGRIWRVLFGPWTAWPLMALFVILPVAQDWR